MPHSLLLAKISLLGLLATFLPLFCGVRRGRLWLFVALLGFFALLVTSAMPTLSGSHGGFAADLRLLAAGASVGVALLAAVTWLAWRHPLLAVPAMIVVMPLRVPVPTGGSYTYLLVPLYIVTLAVAIAEFGVRDRLRLYEWFRRDPTRVALAVVVAVAGVAALWTGLSYAPGATAYAAALVEMFAFYLPFAVIYYLVYRYVRAPADLRRLVLTIVCWGAILALVGLVQYGTHTVLFNSAKILHEYDLGHGFRVNALFWDPNMFGRFLVVVIIVALAAALAPLAWRWRAALLAAAALAATALFVTHSRSALVALGAAVVLFELLWLGKKRGVAAALVTAVLFAAGLYAFEYQRQQLEFSTMVRTTYGWNKLTGGRVYLIDSGWKMFKKHPAGGVGLAGFPLAYPEYRQRRAPVGLSENHTTPITVLAEEGLPGIAAYVALLAAYFTTAVRSAALREDRRLRLLQAGFMAVLLAIIVHSLFYNAFFEDPYMWTVMAMSMALTFVVARERAGEQGKAPESGRDTLINSPYGPASARAVLPHRRPAQLHPRR
ncbi:MAG TPA: O-antigen ligase family protein [Thermoleophilia bacterium]|nr:O-antigen ligase family protein [Thermoleophilia bacterium]